VVFKSVEQKLSVGVNGRVNRLLKIIERYPGKRTNELAGLINAPVKTVEKWIKKLRDEKKVEFRGSAKTGGCYLINWKI